MNRRVLAAGGVTLCVVLAAVAFQATTSDEAGVALESDPDHVPGEAAGSRSSAAERAAYRALHGDASVSRSRAEANGPHGSEANAPGDTEGGGDAPRSSGRLNLDMNSLAEFVPPTQEQLEATRADNEPVVPTEDELSSAPRDGYWGPTANQVTRACQDAARRVIAHGGEPWFEQVVDGCDHQSGLTKSELVSLCEAIGGAASNSLIERLVRVNCNVGPPEHAGVM